MLALRNILSRFPKRAFRTIVICTLSAMLFSVTLAWFSSGQEQYEYQTTKIASAPSTPSAILALVNSSFWSAELVIAGLDGKVYSYDEGSWRDGSIPQVREDTPCPSEIVKSLEVSAGSLSDCRQLQTFGEGNCPPLVSYAITPSGGVWKSERFSSCSMWSTTIVRVIFTGMGCLFGVILILLQWLGNLLND